MKGFLAILFMISGITLSPGFSPDLKRVEPRGGQRGTEVAITFHGDRLYEPQEILFYQEGITVKSLEKGKDHKRAKAVFQIAPNARLGEHVMRLRCKGGLTYMRSFWIGQFPTVMEKRSKDNKRDLNNSFEDAQEIPLNVTVQGVADREDADYYRVQAKKGQRLSVEIEGMRLGRVMFDPYVAILDKNRFELVVNDDSPLLKRDCAASMIVPEDGTYTILVRESSYEGTGASQYRLHVGHFPRPTVVYPPAGKPGEDIELTFIGDASGEIKSPTKLGQETKAIFAKADNLLSPSGIPVHVSPLNYLNEVEPNDGSKTAFPTGEAPKAPTAFHGVISKKEDKDWFRFQAKKGEKLTVQVLARTLRSPLDSVIIIRNAKDNKLIGQNDDETQGKPDSKFDFDVPEDGHYLVNIKDKLDRSGPNFLYRIEITPKSPSLSMSLKAADRNDTQKHKMIEIPRGNRLLIVPNITRKNVRGNNLLTAPQLPSKVSVSNPPITANIGNFPLLFEAASDAPISGGLFPLSIKDIKTGLKGSFTEHIAHIYINNQGDFHSTDTEQISVAVIEEAPFHLELFAPPVPLVRNGTMSLKVTARRAKDFKKKIIVTLPWRPLGVGAPNEVEIPEGKNEAYYTINAKGDAPLKDWKVAVTGRADTDKGQVRVSSKFVPVKIAEPYLKLTLQMAATQPGKNTEMVAKVETIKKFKGDAKVILHALPHGVTAKPLKIQKGTKELNIPLTVTKETRKGKHGNLFCQVLINENGHDIPHNLGHGGVLRVDPPPPAPKKKEVAKPIVKKKDEKPAPKKKTLSRLEQLRQASGK